MPQQISITAAIVAGFLSFLAPCILPLIPAYFAWLLRIPEDQFQQKKIKLKIFLRALALMLGFSLIFIILGASASFLGKFFISYRLLAQKLGGLFIIVLGLDFIGFLKIFKNYRLGLVKKMFTGFNSRTSSFLIGASFAFGWVACFSPILGSILVLSSFQYSLTQGIILLSFYSLGLAVPFILTSLFLGLVVEKIKIFKKVIKWINIFSGLILIIIGLLLFTDYFYKIVMWLTIWNI